MNCKGKVLVVDKPLVMGIINVTPDSFYTGSRQQNTDDVLQKAEQMLQAGAVILDVGGQSTRPNSIRIDASEELSRVIEPIEALYKNFPGAFISIDTFYAEVAKYAIDAGASIVNDISAGKIDAELLTVVASMHVPYVLMHMKGEPETMQSQANYKNVSTEVLDFFIHKKKELHDIGIVDVIIDPGFGFGKTIAHNFRLLKTLEVFHILNAPLMVGISRKATVYKTLGITADESLNGTTVLNTIALMKGASILRVHDVKEAVEAIRLFDAYSDAG